MEQSEGGARVLEVAPILMTLDLEAALARYEALGFRVTDYRVAPDAAPIYGFLHFEGGEIHVLQVEELDPERNHAACYLFVEDVDAAHQAWERAQVAGRLEEPREMPHGMREFNYIDPDGNLLRVGKRG